MKRRNRPGGRCRSHRLLEKLLLPWLLAGLLAGAPAGVWGQTRQTPKMKLTSAINHFRFGDYDEAVTLLNELLTPKVLLAEGDDVREALKILGIACHLREDLEGAREAFVRLLTLEPEFELDPLIVPPQVIDFFNERRLEMQERLEKLEELRQWERQEAERRARERAMVRLVREQTELDRHPHWLNFMPLGIPQFELGRDGWGWAFLAGQVAALGINVGAAALVEAGRNPDGTHSSDAFAQARDIYQPAQVAALVAFGLLYAWSAADGLMAWRPTDRRFQRHERLLPPDSVTGSLAEPGGGPLPPDSATVSP